MGNEINQDPDELAYETLVHFCNIAPYSSLNIASVMKYKSVHEAYEKSPLLKNWYKGASNIYSFWQKAESDNKYQISKPFENHSDQNAFYNLSERCY